MKSLHIVLAILSVIVGIYVLKEKRMVIAGKYSGDLYHLGSLESLLISISFFLMSVFLLLLLSDKPALKKSSEWLLLIILILFILSAFV